MTMVDAAKYFLNFMPDLINVNGIAIFVYDVDALKFNIVVEPFVISSAYG